MINEPFLSFREKIKEFIISQKILTTIASVTIAISAGNVIKSFVSDIIFPAFDFLVKNKKDYKGKHKHKYDPLSYVHLIYFFKELINFIVVLIITFLFIYFFMAGLFNIKEKDINVSSAASAATTVGAENSGGAENSVNI
jgi:large-conductance mechanosensitive channel